MKKRILCALLVLCMAVSMLAMTASAKSYDSFKLKTSGVSYNLAEEDEAEFTFDEEELDALDAVTVQLLVDDEEEGSAVKIRKEKLSFDLDDIGTYIIQAVALNEDDEEVAYSNKLMILVYDEDDYDEDDFDILCDLPEEMTVNGKYDVTFSILVSIPEDAENVTWSFNEKLPGTTKTKVIDTDDITEPGLIFISSTVKKAMLEDGASYFFTIEDDSEYDYSEESELCELIVEEEHEIEVTINPDKKTVAPGKSVTLKVTAEDTTSSKAKLSYQWYSGERNIFTKAEKIKNETDAEYTFNAPKETGTYYYFCKVSSNKSDEDVYATCVLTVSSTAASMDNFVKVNTFTPGMFTDVAATSWYSTYVQKTYELGLMVGASKTTFNPDGNFKVCEAIAVAARIFSTYTNDGYEFKTSSPWYQTYVDYAVSNGIISATDFTNYNAPCTRAQMAYILYRSLPSAEFKSLKTVTALPDVTSATAYSSSIFALYNAGILTGSDKAGTFKPNDNIKRSEVAAIVCRIALPSTRSSAPIG